MTFIQGSTLSVTTDASSAASTYSAETFNGFLHAVVYTPSTAPFSTASGVVISGEQSGLRFLAMSPFNSTVEVAYLPRLGTHTTAGATAGGVAEFPLCNERIKIDVSSGGAARVGTFRFYVS